MDVNEIRDPTKEELQAAWDTIREAGVKVIANISTSTVGSMAVGYDVISGAEQRMARGLLILRAELVKSTQRAEKAEARERHLTERIHGTAEGGGRDAEGLLLRIVKYAREDQATTPGTTRLARALEEAERFLEAKP